MKTILQKKISENGKRNITSYTQGIFLIIFLSLSISMSVFAQPNPPTSVTATPSTITDGETSNLNATSAGNTINWYDVASGGAILGNVNSGIDYPVSPSVTTTYYAESQTADQTADLTITTTSDYGTQAVYFSITPISSETVIDGFPLFENSSGDHTISVYYKTGSYSGYEENSSAWTFWGDFETGGEEYIDITNFTIPASTEYSFYLYSSHTVFLIKSGDITTADDIISISAGSKSEELFGSVSTGYSFRGGVRYITAAGQTSSTRTPVTVTVTAAAPSMVNASPSRIDEGGTSNLNATSAGNTINWYDVASGGTILSNVNSGIDYPVSPSVTTTYYAETQTVDQTSSTRTPVTVKVTVTPPAPSAATASPSAIANGETSNLNATSAGNSINWYDVASGGAILDNVNSGIDYPVSPSVTTTYYAESQIPAETADLTFASSSNSAAHGVYFSITPTNSETVIDGFPYNPNANGNRPVAVYYKTGGYSGYEYNSGAWTLLGDFQSGDDEFIDITDFTIPVNTQYSFYLYSNYTFLSNMSNVNTSDDVISISAGSISYALFGNVSTVESFYGGVRYITFPAGQASSTRTPVTLTVAVRPPAPSAVSASPSTIAEGETSNLNATSAGNTINWYDVATGGTILGNVNSGIDYPVSPSETTIYYAESQSAYLTSSTRTPVIVTLAPPAPSAVSASPSTITEGETSNLNATSVGNTINWYNVASGGTILGNVNSGVDYPVSPSVTTTYYAESQTADETVDLTIAPADYNGGSAWFSITTITSEIIIEGFPLIQNVSGNITVSVYYKTGNYNGYEENQNAWTFLGDFDTGDTEYIDITNLTIPASTEYSFYLYNSASNLMVKDGSVNPSDDNISISAGTAGYDFFGEHYSGYSFSGEVRYTIPGLTSPTRTPVTVSTSNTLTWDGSESSAWNTAGNWDGNSVPSSSDDVIIANAGTAPVIGSGLSGDCNALTTNSGATLTVQSGGSFITAGAITNNGTITVQRSFTNDDRWHLIGVPNNNTTTTSFLDDYLQTWDEPSASWTQVTGNNDAMTPLKGYAFYGTHAKAIYNFTGTPNTGEESIAITYNDNSGSADGTNLLANPYPSAIDWSILDDTYGAVYIWDASLAGANGGGDYIEWNDGIGGGEQYIPPLQGFFIYTATDKTFTIDNTCRTHEGANDFYKSGHSISNGLVLQTIDTKGSDELYIVFNDEAKEDFDLQYDAYKFISTGDGQAQLYSLLENAKLAIDVRPETESIQLGFQNNQNGIYQIGLKEIDGITAVVLEDTKTETFHNLQNGDYEFAWSTSDEETRFILHLKATNTDHIKTNAPQIYANHKTIYIRSSVPLNNAHIEIVNMQGKVIHKKRLTNKLNESITLPLESGVYIVQLVSDEGTQVEKVILK